jgi:methoxymalonate biosynthesis acyl carrier protein
MEEVKESIRQFLAKHVSRERIGDEENIFVTRHVTSLFAMQLVTFIEKEFAIRIQSDDLQFANFQSIGAISRFVRNKMPEKSAAQMAK